MSDGDIAALQARVEKLEQVAGLASQALVYVWGISERVKAIDNSEFVSGYLDELQDIVKRIADIYAEKSDG